MDINARTPAVCFYLIRQLADLGALCLLTMSISYYVL